MVRRAAIQDASAIAGLARRMWDENENELKRDFEALLSRPDAAVFVLDTGDQLAGFAQCQLRRDYVEGTKSSPVGYLEGIFVAEAYRKRGLASQLLSACQQWAREQGCREFASDCELDNKDSLQFHLALGFREANRIICFQKEL